MKLVVIESPYAGDIEQNTNYARACMADSLKRGEAPIASHLLYTQPGILDDNILEQRQQGIEAGFAWNAKADLVAVYEDYDWSFGMFKGVQFALRNNIPIEIRKLYPNQKRFKSPGVS